MKKYLLLVLSILIISSTAAMAESISFGFGTNFFKPSNSGFAVSNGRIFLLDWAIDKDIIFGIYDEETTLDYTEADGDIEIGRLDVTGIRLNKGIIKGVDIGLMLGSATTEFPGFPGASDQAVSSIVDIFGTVTMISGTGGRVTGKLTATLAARYMDSSGLTDNNGDDINNLNGFNASLTVSVGF